MSKIKHLHPIAGVFKCRVSSNVEGFTVPTKTLKKANEITVGTLKQTIQCPLSQAKRLKLLDNKITERIGKSSGRTATPSR
jgi:hypothetical protein